MGTTQKTTALAALLNLLLMGATFAQSVPVPDCCSQAIDLQKRLNRAVQLLDSTRAIGDRLIGTKDARIRELENKANDALRAERAARLDDKRKVMYLVDALKTEALTKRFLGFGRKRAIKRILKQADAL